MCRWKEWCLFLLKNYSNSRFISKSLVSSFTCNTTPESLKTCPNTTRIGLLKLLTALESAFLWRTVGRPNRRGLDAELLVLGIMWYRRWFWAVWEGSRPADDYEIIPSFRMRRRRGEKCNSNNANNTNNNNNNDYNDNHLTTRDSYNRFSRSQSKQQIIQADEHNPFDKSVIVISMPNGDFFGRKTTKTFSINKQGVYKVHLYAEWVH